MPCLKELTHTPRRSGDTGFSLVEVLVALVIIAVGIMAAAQMLSTSVHYSSSARLITEATEIAQHQMEKLMSAPYNDVNLKQALSPYGPVAINTYSLSWGIRQDLPMTAMKTIRVTVAWNDHGETKSLSIDAIKH